jgi:Heterokaryon incompatibility protein (HET)
VDDLPTYEALSYTWGDITVTNTISCNGLLLRVHSNAWHALIDLRQDNDSRMLWIDAICINQQDNAEKSVQIQLMRQIYSRANQVPIWIKPVTVDITLAFSTLSSLSALLETENTADRLTSFTAAGLSSRGLPDAKNEIWKALDALLWSPWFSRIWIIQEISLAREAFLVSALQPAPGRMSRELRILYTANPLLQF